MELSQEEKTVYDWLDSKLQMPVFAEAYLAALCLMRAKRPGYITLVAHTGRDFMNILPTTVGDIGTSQVQYVQLVEAVKGNWSSTGTGLGFGNSGDSTEGQVIPYETSHAIQKLIDEHNGGRERSEIRDSLFFSIFLDYDHKENIPANLLRDWKQAREWFQQLAHLRQQPLPEYAPQLVEQHFQTLQEGLYAAASTEFDRLKDLHEILEETNS